MSKKTVTIKMIAEKANVSIATVSRALQTPPSKKVSAQQRQHILDICQKLHYYPNEHSRRLAGGRAATMAILFPQLETINSDIANFDVDIALNACILGAQEQLSKYGIGLLLYTYSQEYIANKSYLTPIRGRAIDGILLWGGIYNDLWLKDLLAENIPIVFLQNAVNQPKTSSVIADDYSGMSNLVEKLILLGHRNFGLIPAKELTSTGFTRNLAVKETLARHNITLAAIYSEEGYGYELGRKAGAEFMPKIRQLTAIICSNDMTALGCIEYLKEQGIRVPDDISIVGAGGLRFPGQSKLDTYLSPSREIGACGAKLLYEQSQTIAPSPTQIKLPTPIIEGNTVKRV